MDSKNWIKFDESSIAVLKSMGMQYLAFIGDEDEDVVNIYPFKTRDRAELFMIASGCDASEKNNLVQMSEKVMELTEEIEPFKVRVLFS
ncbi:MAG: hypothetical protein ACJ77K_12615 [Bacteroidia bacterium]